MTEAIDHDAFFDDLPDGSPVYDGHVVMVYWGSFMAQSNGSHSRAAALLDFLCRRFKKVSLYSYFEHPVEPWTDDQRRAFNVRFPQVDLILDHERSALKAMKKVKEVLVTVVPKRARGILKAKLPGCTPGLSRLQKDGPGAFVVNYVDGLARLNGIDCSQTVVETHDLKFLKRSKMNKSSPISVMSLVRQRNEIGSLSVVSGVIAITEAEAAFFRLMIGEENVFCAPIYDRLRPLGHSNSGSDVQIDFDYDMLFAASENPLNERGIIRFLNDNSSWLSGKRIALCGRICELPSIREQAVKNKDVELLGFVDDLPSLYRRSKICLSPTDGTGLKIKLLEALQIGRPVLASAHSMGGLPKGYESCVFPIDGDTVNRLLSNDADLSAAEAAARSYFSTLSDFGDQARLGTYLGELVLSNKEDFL